MKRHKTILFILFLCTVPFVFGTRREIKNEWYFKKSGDTFFNPANVPGTVHTDLMELGIIPDPFVGINEKDVQWIDKEDWIYETSFDLSKEELGNRNINLIFEGLDTYADIYLNDSLVLKADNMFRNWTVPVKNIIKEKNNLLSIYFHSPIKIDVPKYDALPYHLYAGNDQSENGGLGDKKISVFARKAGYQYGWDWGPRMVTSGIWRPVYLESWSDVKIEDIYVYTDSITDNIAYMQAELEIKADREGAYKIEISSDKVPLAVENVNLNSDSNKIIIPFVIHEPKLWWSTGLGDPFLYDLNFSLKSNDNIIAEETKKTGIRKIELIREKDKDGTSFYFSLNGKPVFAKGSNYIPQDSFLPRVNEERYRKTIEATKNANMNMLRVWGGGIYENDRFYELCDSLGIMVWQDFMFACSLYPGDDNFMKNVESEAEENIKRLRNHPSIALWCGNNEILEAWQYWGFREDYEDEGSDREIWNNYTRLFNELLPEVVAQYSRDISYWASSPSDGENESRNPMNGDSHIWNVWGWNEPIERYNELPGRFISEYGFQSFPELKTLYTFAPDSTTHKIDSEVMMAHQRAGNTGNARLMNYILENYHRPKDFKAFVKMTQMLQADAMKTAIEAHRKLKPLCMGSLMWQLDDCWPVVSWSTIDYYGNWKAAHYQAKRSFDEICVSGIIKNDSIEIYLVSDYPDLSEGKLSIETYGLEGKKLGEWIKQLELNPDSVSKIVLPLDHLGLKSVNKDFVVDLKFEDAVGIEFCNTVLSDFPKNLNFIKPEIDITVECVDKNYLVKIRSDRFVKGFNMTLPFDEFFFEDNYFDLIPDREYVVGLITPSSLKEVSENLTYSSYIDLIQSSK